MPPDPAPKALASPRRPALRRQRRKEARPQELLAAALSLFVEKGFAATRSEEVAARAGVSKGTLYLYYPSKEELFKAVVREGIVNLITEGAALAASFEGDTSDLLAALMTLWWQRVGNTPAAGIHKIVLGEVRNFPELQQFYLEEVMLPGDALFSTTVQRGIDRGEFRQVPVHEVAHALMAPMIFLCLHQHAFGACSMTIHDIAPEDLIRTQLDLTLRGLQVRPAAGRRRDAK